MDFFGVSIKYYYKINICEFSMIANWFMPLSLEGTVTGMHIAYTLVE